nr:MAG TPA: hypothetical protein [Caudoviricetes sp.]
MIILISAILATALLPLAKIYWVILEKVMEL